MELFRVPLSEVTAIIAMCTLAVVFTPIISPQLHLSRLLRTTLDVILVAGLLSIMLSVFATQLASYLMGSYTEGTWLFGFLSMIKLGVPNWISASLVLLSTLIGFQWGMRLTFSNSIPPETPEITTETSTSRKRK